MRPDGVLPPLRRRREGSRVGVHYSDGEDATRTVGGTSLSRPGRVRVGTGMCLLQVHVRRTYEDGGFTISVMQKEYINLPIV